MKPSRFYRILIYIRRPLCFAVVLSIVAIYLCSYSAFAEESESVTLVDLLDCDMEDFYRINDALSIYEQNGFSANNLYRTSIGMQYRENAFPFSSSVQDSNFSTYFNLINNYGDVGSWYQNPKTFDLSKARVIVFASGSNDIAIQFYVHEDQTLDNDNFYIVNGYVISEQSYYRVEYNSSKNVVNADWFYSNSSNGFKTSSVGNRYLLYTDMDIFFGSSNGESGFINLTDTTNNGFSVSDVDNYFNFNYLSLRAYPPSSDVLPPENYVPQGQYYNYAYVNGYITPVSSASFNTHLNFSYNEYMRTHPEEFDIRILTFATLYESNNRTPSFTYKQRFPLTNVTNLGSHYDSDNSSYVNLVTFDDLVDTGGNSVSDELRSIYTSAGGSSGMYEPDSIVKFDIITGITSETSGKWTIRRTFNTYLEKIVIQQSIYFIWTGGEPESASGIYKLKYESGSSGSSVEQNDIVNNYNPPSTNDPQYPQEITNGQGQVIVGGTTINPTFESNINAAIEYLFNLDATDLNNIAGNTQNAIQHVITTLGDTSENGFWGVLQRTYSMIPNDIWNWIKVAVGAICGGAIIGWVFRVGRVKNSN